MSRTFAYCRVSTGDQTTDNQVREIEAAGFNVDPKRIVSETISGSVAAMERKGFAKLIDRLESGDVLIVTKLDRLGRNAMDLRATVERLADEGVRVHCLALGGVDLTSAAGKMTMAVIAAAREFVARGATAGAARGADRGAGAPPGPLAVARGRGGLGIDPPVARAGGRFAVAGFAATFEATA